MKSIIAGLVLTIGLVGPVSISPCSSGAAVAQTIGYSCCKICKAGKACGDTCIPRDHNCKKGPGCACDG